MTQGRDRSDRDEAAAVPDEEMQSRTDALLGEAAELTARLRHQSRAIAAVLDEYKRLGWPARGDDRG